ncbi:cation diffusion facilitator family transporter [Paenibacillus sp. CF384]|uniref:cation diffusion facilitator family transporter n=1 Tax=Paenibacillus sp. CF384 TaxID=1884382 RepID=UPI000897D58C|nr:cation diffusion facilitator family transporter [Paenibacillus sp. CF384]SDW15067.1 cation diffusion facilitator family transporter [Paenibacillus sp. CF384]
MEQQKYDQLKIGERGALLSIIAYILLSSLKLTIGYMTGSEALQADGLNNATDIAASIAVLIGLRLARKPADDDHPYGHWKSETISSMLASFIMMVVGLQVLYQSVTSIFQGDEKSPDLLAAWVGIFSAVVMYSVYRYNKKLAAQINSQAVMAAAKDNLSDAFVSLGTFVGIIGSQFHLAWLDPLTAIVVGIIICRTAWVIFREASHHLSDGFNEETILSFKEIVLNVQGVEDVRDIRARNYGSNAVVDVTLLIKGDMEFQEAHDVATRVEMELKNSSNDVYEVHVHYEPVE